VLLVALQHCPRSAADESRSARWHQSILVAKQSIPFGDAGHGCENELGCICRGAIVMPIIAPHDGCSVSWLPCICGDPLATGIHTGWSHSARGSDVPPEPAIPLFGRQLRARIASFLN